MNLFIANVSYNNTFQNLSAQLRAHRTPGVEQIHHFELASSLLTWSFNTAWVHALNLRKSAGITHFLLWHSDVQPMGEDWLRVFLDEFESNEADVLSAIIPIKDSRGLTSTALDTDEWRPKRITTHEANEVLPVSWTNELLLINSGLMLCDFTKPWVEKICFTMRDEIVQQPDGEWVVRCEPEDWNFSRQCRRLGLKLVATRAVTVQHHGAGCWSSASVWGDPIDKQNEFATEKVLIDG